MTKKNKPPKRHHFVPQVYLRYFSPDEVNIFRYEKTIKTSVLLSIEKVAKINDYYTHFSKSTGRDTSFENPFLSNIEGLYPGLVEDITNQTPLSKQHDYIALFLAVMHSRVPAQRDSLTDTLKTFHEQTDVLGPVPYNLSLEGMLAHMKVYAESMQNSFFWIGIAQGDSYFITSDNPAGRSYLPLTTKLCLFSSQDKKEVEYVPIEPEFVHKINQKTFDNADQYVFSISDEFVQFTP